MKIFFSLTKKNTYFKKIKKFKFNAFNLFNDDEKISNDFSIISKFGKETELNLIETNQINLMKYFKFCKKLKKNDTVKNFFGNFYKTGSNTFSTKIIVDEIEPKKKEENNKKDNKKILELEKINEEDKRINVIDKSNLKTKSINVEGKFMNDENISTHPEFQIDKKSENKEQEELEEKDLKLKKMKYMKELSPELKNVIGKKITKIYQKKNLKKIYSETNNLTEEIEEDLDSNDPFKKLLNNQNNSDISSNEIILSKIQNENSRIGFNNSLQKNAINLKSTNYENDEKYDFNNQDFFEYKKALETLHFLIEEFNIQEFRYLVYYIKETPIEDTLALNTLEEILINNLKEIDCIIKSELILILAKNLQKKKIKFNENNWYLIYKDFRDLLHINVIKFKDFYNYTLAFEKIKNIILASNANYINEFEKFIKSENLSLLNSGKIEFQSLDDILLLSSLIHSKIVEIISISDMIWLSLNNLILANSMNININTILIMTSLLIRLSEVSTQSPFLLSQAINVILNSLNVVFSNYEFLDSNEKLNLINFSDSLFNFYLRFIHYNNFPVNNLKNAEDLNKINLDYLINNNGFLLKNLITVYTEKMKIQHNFNFLQEVKILIFLSKELRYFDQEFWSNCSGNLINFLKYDFNNKISDIFPKRIPNANSKVKFSYNEAEEMSKLFYYGIVIEVFSTVNYYDKLFWNNIFEKIDEIIPNSKKDPLILMQFIYLHCQKLYKNRKYDKIYEKLVNSFSPIFKRIFLNREILDFLIEVNFQKIEFDREKNYKIILSLINPLNRFRPSNHIKKEIHIYPEGKNKNNFNHEDKNNFSDKSTYSFNVAQTNSSVSKSQNLQSFEESEKKNLSLELNEIKHENLKEIETNESDLEIMDDENEALEKFNKEYEQNKIKYQLNPNQYSEDFIEKNNHHKYGTEENEPHNVLLLITYLNLLWNRSIFEEEVRIFLYKILYLFFYIEPFCNCKRFY